MLRLTSDSSPSVRKSAVYHLRFVPRNPEVAEVAWHCLRGADGFAASEALQTYAAHASAREANERLTELARTDGREGVRTRAISGLADLGAGPELESLIPLLREPPGLTWAVHIGIIDAVRTLGLPEPALDDLAAVDNLDLIESVLALRRASRR